VITFSVCANFSVNTYTEGLQDVLVSSQPESDIEYVAKRSGISLDFNITFWLTTYQNILQTFSIGIYKGLIGMTILI
jgi:assimilatory nitrate reductase catalytic subunit